MRTLKRMISALLLWSISYSLYGSFLKDLPVTVTQPDGTVLHILATGSEAHNWYHDASNFTIIKNAATGYYVYAVNSPEGDVIPSSFLVGTVAPSSVGIVPGINLSDALMKKKMDAFKASRAIPAGKQAKVAGPQAMSKFGGNMNELVVFIRFNNQGPFTRPMSYFNDNFNNVNATSVRGFYREASGNQIDILTYFAPTQSGTSVITYNHNRPRTYYQKDTPDGYANTAPSSTEREHQLLVDAVNAIKAQVPANINFDANNDGNIDNVVFIIQGNTDAWGDLLWPHRWSLFSKNVSINGKRVYDYNLTFENGSGAGVLSHELFHTFGAPDLYRYSNNNITPSGPWDLMSGGTWETPVHMNAYYKQKYGGWVSSIPTITTAGTYTLDPINRSPFSAYKIPIPNSTRGEFLLLEYRKKEGRYDYILPSEGLVIYRITPDLNGNGDGPDDEVYVYRPGGTKSVDGNINLAAFSMNTNRTRLDDFSNPSSFMTNTQPGGFAQNLGITNVSVIGDKISFDFKGGGAVNPSVTLTAPANGASFIAPATVSISANASIASGSITKVDFFNGAILLGSDNSAPYAFVWNNVAAGNYNITAVATSNAGKTATSAVASIQVNAPVCTIAGTKLPGTVIGTTGSWSNLGDTRDKVFDGNINTFFDSPDVIGWAGLNLNKQIQITGIRYYPRIGWSARMVGGKFQGSNSADFSTGVVDLFTVTTDPLSNWTCVAVTNAGNYRYVRYISPSGSHGNIAEAEFYGKEIIVNPPNAAPTVNITGPANNSSFTAPGNISITANAADADGTVSKVEFFNGSILLGTDVSAPYSFLWTNVATGSYTISAKATDNLGATTTSGAVTIAVNPVVSAEGINGPDCVNANTNNTYTFASANNTATNVAWWCNCDVTFTPGADSKITTVRFGAGNPATVTLTCGVNLSVAPWYQQFTKNVKLGGCPAAGPAMAPVTIITPNPSEDVSVVSMETEETIIEITVYDAMGKLVLTETNINKTEVLLGKNIPVGLYTVVTQTPSGISRKQFIKH